MLTFDDMRGVGISGMMISAIKVFFLVLKLIK